MAKEGLQFEFSASTAEYRKAVESMPRDLQKAADEIEEIGQEINTSMSKAVGRGLVQGLAAGGVVLKLRQVIDQFDQLADAAKRFGASAEDIQRIDVAAKQSGSSLEIVATAMEEAGTKANKAAREGGKFLESFSRSGIDAAAFASAGLAEKIEMVGAAQAAAAGDSQRMADITEALGQSVGRVDFATMASGMKHVSVLSNGMVDALSRANDQLQGFDRGLNLVAGFTLGLLGEAFQRATSAAIALGTQDFSIFGKSIEELKAMTEGLPPLFDKTATSVDGAGEATVNYSDVIKRLITVNAEMEASMARMEKGAGSFGAQLAEAELKLAELSQQFSQSGDAEVFKEIQKTAKEILSLRQQTAKEEEKIRGETSKTSEEYRKQADAQARAIMSLDHEIQMLQAKLSGNEALTEELQRQQDFRKAFAKTGNAEQADRFAELRAQERQMQGEDRLSRSPVFAAGQAPQTNLDQLREAAQTDPNARAALMRLQNEQSRAMNRAGDLRARGFFRSAASAELRAERNAERAASRELQKQFTESMFGERAIGDAAREFQKDAQRAGMTTSEALERMGINRSLGESTQDALRRFVEEQSKTEIERKEDAARAGKGSGAGGPAGTAQSQLATESTLQDLVNEVKNWNALTAAA